MHFTAQYEDGNIKRPSMTNKAGAILVGNCCLTSIEENHSGLIDLRVRHSHCVTHGSLEISSKSVSKITITPGGKLHYRNGEDPHHRSDRYRNESKSSVKSKNVSDDTAYR